MSTTNSFKKTGSISDVLSCPAFLYLPRFTFASATNEPKCDPFQLSGPVVFSPATANAVILYRSSSFAFPSRKRERERERESGEKNYLTSGEALLAGYAVAVVINMQGERAMSVRRTTLDFSRGRAGAHISDHIDGTTATKQP